MRIKQFNIFTVNQKKKEKNLQTFKKRVIDCDDARVEIRSTDPLWFAKKERSTPTSHESESNRVFPEASSERKYIFVYLL